MFTQAIIPRPSCYCRFPNNTILRKVESDQIALNIMIILKRTGDEFRELSWEEYREERLKDGRFTEGEKAYFDQVIQYCVSPDKADEFCKDWFKEE